MNFKYWGFIHSYIGCPWKSPNWIPLLQWSSFPRGSEWLACCILNSGHQDLGTGAIEVMICIFQMNAKCFPIGCGGECDIIAPLTFSNQWTHFINSFRKWNTFSEWCPSVFRILQGDAHHRTWKQVEITGVVVSKSVICSFQRHWPDMVYTLTVSLPGKPP